MRHLYVAVDSVLMRLSVRLFVHLLSSISLSKHWQSKQRNQEANKIEPREKEKDSVESIPHFELFRSGCALSLC